MSLHVLANGLFVLGVKMLSKFRVEQLLSFDEKNGVFVWKFNRGGKAQKGSIAGGVDSKGYRQIRIDGTLYLAHRLVWLITYGEWPEHDIDHVDRNPLNIRPENLRKCSDHENQQNVAPRKDNKSGVAGVYFYEKSKKWKAHITFKGRTLHLGTFSTFEDAVEARLKAKRDLHTFSPKQIISSKQWGEQHG